MRVSSLEAERMNVDRSTIEILLATIAQLEGEIKDLRARNKWLMKLIRRVSKRAGVKTEVL